MSYEVRIQTVPARVVDFAKNSMKVEFFVAESSGPWGRESLSERLNRETTTFLACRIDDERELLNVSHIAYVEMLTEPLKLSELDEIGARSEEVQLELVTDEIVRGHVRFEAREEDRLSDLLNSGGGRFLLLSDGERTLYVQRDAIRRVRFTSPRS